MWRDRQHRGDGRTLRRWLTVVASILVGGVLGVLVHALMPTDYSTSAYVVVTPTAAHPDSSAALRYTPALGRLVADPVTLLGASRPSGIAAGNLAQIVRARTSPDAPLIEVTATSSSPELSARAANGVAAFFVSSLNGRSDDTQVRLSVLAAAPVPPEPSSLAWPRAALVGLAAGLLVGGILVGVRRKGRAVPPERADEMPEPSAGTDRSQPDTPPTLSRS
jgi:uncharacterized protein involved in exopolysaccharide biosynthesis